ncbi:MAG TPA: GNAT family N-acetyltransferase [Ktedonobacteraceae bacterium]|jgi:ribosomal protein S18 acetylase RimI-like enzyme
MSQPLIDLALLPAARVEQAACLLARAFQDDPLMGYLLPRATRRVSVLPAFFRVVLRYCLRYGVVYTTETLAGVACCLPPHQTRISRGRVMRIALGGTLWLPGPFELLRSLQAASSTDQLHARVAPAAHWYLWVLGVEPQQQGRGTGGQLLRRVIQQADVRTVPCYLETENPRNVPFYQTYGFRLVRQVTLPQSAVHIYALLREAG